MCIYLFVFTHCHFFSLILLSYDQEGLPCETFRFCSHQPSTLVFWAGGGSTCGSWLPPVLFQQLHKYNHQLHIAGIACAFSTSRHSAPRLVQLFRDVWGCSAKWMYFSISKCSGLPRNIYRFVCSWQCSRQPLLQQRCLLSAICRRDWN